MRIPVGELELPLLGNALVAPLGVGESARAGMSPEAKDSEKRVKVQDMRQKEQFVCS